MGLESLEAGDASEIMDEYGFGEDEELGSEFGGEGLDRSQRKNGIP